ncbi:MAG: oligosaccharide flippase family protein [Acholeplasmatales bacterium]|nr:oligosaccharide flippase family protein [Acholeplasmatales bacterium]
MAQKSIAKNYIYNLTYQIIALITPILTMPYVSRVLGVDHVGEYSFAFSCVLIFAIIGNFGFSTYGQLTIAYFKEDKALLSSNFTGILIAHFVTVLISAGMYFIYILLFDSNNLLYYVLFIHLIAIAIDISWFYQGIEEFKTIAIINTVTK